MKIKSDKPVKSFGTSNTNSTFNGVKEGTRRNYRSLRNCEKSAIDCSINKIAKVICSQNRKKFLKFNK